MRGLLPDATHIYYARRSARWRGTDIVEFASDAGEPRGSAGAPIINVLRQAELVDVAAWVARYYGGKKLGLPGLMAAYTKAVRLTLAGAATTPWADSATLSLVAPYPLVESVLAEVRRAGGRITDEGYTHRVTLVVRLPRGQLDAFVSGIRGLGGREIAISLGAIDSGGEDA